MQLHVQSAWDTIPVHLNELRTADFITSFLGINITWGTLSTIPVRRL
jgi:hypothetical protein